MQALAFFDVSGLSPYDTVCEKANHPAPYPTLEEVEEAGRKVAECVLRIVMDTALEDHADVIVEGMIGGFHSAALRLERAGDKARGKIREINRYWTASEIEDESLQEATEETYRADAAAMIVESVRDAAAEFYTHATGNVWTPWTGNQKNTARATFAQIEARQALKAKQDEKRQLCAPGDQVVAFRGAMKAKTATDANRVFDALNFALSTYPKMKLATTGNHGAEQIAIKWAKQKGVQHILAAADFDKHNKAAPFRANDDLLALEPVLVLILAASLETAEGEEVKPFGPCNDLAKRARENGVQVIGIAPKKAQVSAA